MRVVPRSVRPAENTVERLESTTTRRQDIEFTVEQGRLYLLQTSRQSGRSRR
jgi:hypothetical protein